MWTPVLLFKLQNYQNGLVPVERSTSQAGQAIEEGTHTFRYGCVWQPSCCKNRARMNFNGFLCTFWSTRNVSFHRQITMLTVGRSMEALVRWKGVSFDLWTEAFFGRMSVWSHCSTGVRWILCVETIVKNRLEWYLGSWVDGFSPR